MNEKERERVRPPRDGSKKPNKKSGFYVALYACAGVMLTIAVIIGANRLAGPSPAGDAEARVTPAPTARATAPPANERPGAQPGAQATPTATQPPGTPTDGRVPANTVMPTAAPSVPAQGTSSIDYFECCCDYYAFLNALNGYGDGDYATHPVFAGDGEPLVLLPYDDFVNETPDFILFFDDPDNNYTDVSAIYGASQYGFVAFTDDDRMTWPVYGEIIMEYSTTALIYNPTLSSWRVNPNVAISSPQGTQVSAAAAGRVTDVSSTREHGRTVTIDHGNGWSTTYSQLQSDVRVRVGDVVIRGQAIGYVGEPSHHSSALAPHVAFQVFHNESTVNPRTILSTR